MTYAVSLTPAANVQVYTPLTIAGTYEVPATITGAGTTGNFAYTDGTGTAMALPTGAVIGDGSGTLSFKHPGFTAPGTFAIDVSVVGHVVSAPINVVVFAAPVLTLTSGGQVTDGSGNVWTLTSAGDVSENGVNNPAGSGTKSLSAYQGTIYAQDGGGSNLWYTWDGANWNSTGSTTLPGSAPPPPVESPDQTVVTAAGGGSIIDANLHVWTIVGGVAMRDGVAAGISSNVTELAYVSHVPWQKNSAGFWWHWNGSLWSGTGTSTSPLGGGTTPPPTIANFSIRNGKIYDPAGNIFIPKGINVGHPDMGNVSQNAANQPLTLLLAGINHIRLNTGMASNSGSAQALPFDMGVYLPFLERMTGYTRQSDGSWLETSTNHIVVELEDHDGNSSFFPRTADELAAVVHEYATWGAYLKGNPYAWIGTLNEMDSEDGSYSQAAIAAMSDVHKAEYDAVRNTGNTNIIQVMMGVGGSNPSTVGANAGYKTALYSLMTNITWELHWYPDVMNAADSLANLMGGISTAGGGPGGSGIIAAQSIQSADGMVPVILGEWGAGNGDVSGNSTAGATSAVLSVQAEGHGSTAWQWVGDGVSQWACTGNGNGQAITAAYLTGWGAQVATVCASTTT